MKVYPQKQMMSVKSRHLDLTPAIILTVLFCKVNIILLLGGITPKNYSIFHFGMEIGKIN
jgi:hypothetical protein